MVNVGSLDRAVRIVLGLGHRQPTCWPAGARGALPSLLPD